MNGGYFWRVLPLMVLLVSMLLTGAALLMAAINEIRKSMTDWTAQAGTSPVWKALRDAYLKLTSKWRNRGEANPYWVILIAVFALVAFASVPLKHVIEPAPTITAHWWFFPHIPEQMPDNEYVVLLLDKSDPLYSTRPRYTFCSYGKRIDFDEGELLTDIVYKEHGDCKELLHYNFEREATPPFKVKHYPEESDNAGR